MGPYGYLFDSHADTDEEKEFEMVYRQHTMTEPFPESFLSHASDYWKARLQEYRATNEEHGRGMTWRYVMGALKIPEQIGLFVERLLRIYPADRPSASTLLADKWLKDDSDQ